MRSDWSTIRLSDITDWSSGGTPSKNNADFWKGDIPWISASSMDGNRYRKANHYISQEALSKTRLAPKGTILLLVRGSILHQKIQIGIAQRDVAFNQDVKGLIVNDPEIDPEFLLYWFEGNRHKLLGLVENTGIGAGKLDTKVLKNLKVNLPPTKERNWITNFFTSIDDKIELNRKMNETLEEMAQALFKSWFVDFDPVLDKALAAGNEIPVPLQILAEKRKQVPDSKKLIHINPELAKGFPDRFTFTEELGWIPEGWEVDTFGWFANVFGGFAFKSRDFMSSGNFPVVKIKNINSTGGVDLEDCQSLSYDPVKLDSKFKLQPGDLIMAMTGATVGKFGLVVPRGKSQPLLNQRVAKYVSTLENDSRIWFIYFYLKQNHIFDHIVNSAYGSAQPNISASDLLRTPAIKVSPNLVRIFNDLVDGNMMKSLSNYKANEVLKSLRDTLLPKLISGELRVPEAGLPDRQAGKTVEDHG